MPCFLVYEICGQQVFGLPFSGLKRLDGLLVFSSLRLIFNSSFFGSFRNFCKVFFYFFYLIGSSYFIHFQKPQFIKISLINIICRSDKDFMSSSSDLQYLNGHLLIRLQQLLYLPEHLSYFPKVYV
jgi:hypothetical protein